MRQRANRVETQISPHFEPDFVTDFAHQRRLEPGTGQRRRQQLCSGRLDAVKFAQTEAIALNELNHARFDQLGSGIHHAADYPGWVQMLGDDPAGVGRLDRAPLMLTAVPIEIPPGYSVLHGHHGSVLMHQEMQIGSHRRNLVRFQREQDHVVGASVGKLFVGAGASADQFAPVIQDELHSVRTNGLQIGSAGDEADFLAAGVQTDPKVAADRAGTYYRYFHLRGKVVFE